MLMHTAGTDESHKYRCPCFKDIKKATAEKLFNCRFLKTDGETVYEQWEGCHK